ncbi:hypothetical protein [Nonomuraea wenchangensis]|uniref:hypothetical protein n=1 Tax=Nonomuraea wenchangensis TaxID=568860 RepID=UPI00331B157A
MAARNARLHLTPGFLGSEIEINGVRIPHVRNVHLDAEPHNLPALTLDFVLREVEVDGEMVVTVPEKTHAALVALGWTPPADDEPGQGVVDVDPAPLAAYNQARRDGQA